MAKVVKYNGKIYLWYKTNEAGLAQLLDDAYTKFPGTPRPDKLEVLKEVPTITYNGHDYAITKRGLISCTTGESTHYKNIVELAQKHYPELCKKYEIGHYRCVVCKETFVDAWAGIDTCDACLSKI